jgi:hypothetical protein
MEPVAEWRSLYNRVEEPINSRVKNNSWRTVHEFKEDADDSLEEKPQLLSMR